MKIKKLPLREFRRIYSKVPRLCVEIILVERGKVLLVHRTIAPYANQWHFPGGTVLKGETFRDTAERVAREELGVQVTVKKFLGVIEYPLLKERYSQGAGIIFLASRRDTKKIKLDENGSAFDYFSRLPTDTVPEHKEFLQQALGFRVSGK